MDFLHAERGEGFVVVVEHLFLVDALDFADQVRHLARAEPLDDPLDLELFERDDLPRRSAKADLPPVPVEEDRPRKRCLRSCLNAPGEIDGAKQPSFRHW